MAMIKLWEESSIAKIALKRGVQLTTSERMAEDLKVIAPGNLPKPLSTIFVVYFYLIVCSINVSANLCLDLKNYGCPENCGKILLHVYYSHDGIFSLEFTEIILCQSRQFIMNL